MMPMLSLMPILLILILRFIGKWARCAAAGSRGGRPSPLLLLLLLLLPLRAPLRIVKATMPTIADAVLLRRSLRSRRRRGARQYRRRGGGGSSGAPSQFHRPRPVPMFAVRCAATIEGSIDDRHLLLPRSLVCACHPN